MFIIAVQIKQVPMPFTNFYLTEVYRNSLRDVKKKEIEGKFSIQIIVIRIHIVEYWIINEMKK